MNHARAFIAGFLSTLIFHQAVIALFYAMDLIPRAPWSLAATPPLGVPAVISLAFWGGVWGVVLWYFLRSATGRAYWVRALVIGAIGPTAVAFLVVAPLKGAPYAMATDPKLWIGGFIVNGVWGLGVAWLLRVLRRVGF